LIRQGKLDKELEAYKTKLSRSLADIDELKKWIDTVDIFYEEFSHLYGLFATSLEITTDMQNEGNELKRRFREWSHNNSRISAICGPLGRQFGCPELWMKFNNVVSDLYGVSVILQPDLERLQSINKPEEWKRNLLERLDNWANKFVIPSRLETVSGLVSDFRSELAQVQAKALSR
jgi:hypothetical protein